MSRPETCPRCGALIGDPQLHARWHREHESPATILERVEALRQRLRDGRDDTYPPRCDMTTQTLTLADFLLARIAEDKTAAQSAIQPEHMHPWGDRSLPQLRIDQVPAEVEGYLGGAWGEHFARHDPARVLAECAAKRQIVEEHYRVDPCDAHDARFETIPCETLRALASVYADHPAYDPAWA